jgi:hypothetical protein
LEISKGSLQRSCVSALFFLHISLAADVASRLHIAVPKTKIHACHKA